MPPSAWANYLDEFSKLLDDAQAAFESSNTVPALRFEGDRPSGPIPPELQVAAFEAVMRCERLVAAGEQRRDALADSRRVLAYRARLGSSPKGFAEAL